MTSRATLALAAALLALGCQAAPAPPPADPTPLRPAVGCAPRAPVAAIPAGPLALWAAPAGEGLACTPAAPCALETALERLRPLTGAMTGDLRLVLRGGTYALAAPLELCEDGAAHDSGTNGFRLIVEAAPGERPILSGGRRLGPWSPAPGRPGVLRAAAPGLRTRQLFVNGVRATRARTGPGGPVHAKSPFGFVRGDRLLAGEAGLEVVGRASFRTYRCPVALAAPAAGGATSLEVAEPCWSNSQGRRTEGEVPFEEVAWIENALVLLDEPGEWFLDEAEGAIYYAPRPGEDLATAEVVAPVLEGLLRIAGGTDADGAPAFVHDVVVRGLGFRHTTWLAPSGPAGYAEGQAGFHRVGIAEDLYDRTPGAVTVARARRVRIERCTFDHLGQAGLDVVAGSKEIAVAGNVFHDLSSTAIQAGDVVDPEGADEAWRAQDLLVEDNLVRRAAVEYEGAVGIFVGYAERARVAHNDVADLPYTGISVGWGWTAPPYQRGNAVVANRVEDVMQVLLDGGALYTLGQQPGSVMTGNAVARSGLVGLFHDEETVGYTTTGNVVSESVWWLYMWNPNIERNVVTGNWADLDHAYCAGAPAPSAACNFSGNQVGGNVFGTPFPPEAEAIRAAAGLEPAYRDLAIPPG